MTVAVRLPSAGDGGALGSGVGTDEDVVAVEVAIFRPAGDSAEHLDDIELQQAGDRWEASITLDVGEEHLFLAYACIHQDNDSLPGFQFQHLAHFVSGCLFGRDQRIPCST